LVYRSIPVARYPAGQLSKAPRTVPAGRAERLSRLAAKAEAGGNLAVQLVGGADLRAGLDEAGLLADGSSAPDVVIVEPTGLPLPVVREASLGEVDGPARFLWLTGDADQAAPFLGVAEGFDFVFAAELSVALELSRELGPERVGVAPLPGRRGGEEPAEPDASSETRMSAGLLGQLITEGHADAAYSRAIWNYFDQAAGPGRPVVLDPAAVAGEHSHRARLCQMVAQATGKPLEREPWPAIARQLAQAAARPQDRDRGWQVKPAAWRTGRFAALGGALHAWRDGADLVWEVARGEGTTMSLGLRGSLPLTRVAAGGALHVELSGQGTAEGQVAITLMDANGGVVQSRWHGWNARHRVVPPPEAARVRLAVRALGSGVSRFTGVKLADHERRETLPLKSSRDRVLLISAGYPSADNLYSFGFVHTRVKVYQELGFEVDVMVLQPSGAKEWREHLGVQVLQGPPELLHQLIESGRYAAVGVHFLKPHVWEALKEHVGAVALTIWVHGSDIQPWWRRGFAIESAEDHDRLVRHTENLMDMWRQVVPHVGEAVKLVFVSRTFAAEVAEDLAEFDLRLPPGGTAVVNNGVDTDLFAYRPKPPAQRLRVLMIRSFASRKYGTDLAAQAIEALSREPFFGELRFLIIGDGELWGQDAEPLARFANVELRRGFATHQEIAELQQDYGVMLQPTRWDSQGVSRDEAMACGLVVISNAVAAVPEFMSEAEGYLAAPDDPNGIVQAIGDLYRHPDVFAAKSAAAARRVRSSMTMAQMAAQEIALLKEGTGVG
jgi:glycosyltransferase involved in cell wall biosynthesis